MEPPVRIALVKKLLADTRAAALATTSEKGPYSSLAPICPAADYTAVYLHLSRMALHTRNLEGEPRASLLLAEADGPDKNPLALIRATLTGAATVVAPGTPEHTTAKAQYVARFPDSEMMFQLPDFYLYAFRPASIQLVAGFGKAYRITPGELASG